MTIGGDSKRQRIGGECEYDCVEPHTKRENTAQIDLWNPIEQPRSPAEPAREIKPFCTLKEAAAQLNLKPWHLRRMAKRGELKLYFIGNNRARVILREVVEAIRRYSEQGAEVGGVR
jgi:excisionase family DNA binding protein